MEYDLILKIKIDPDANFISVDEINSSGMVLELFKDIIYDLDDVTLINCEVRKDEYNNT